MTHYIAPNQEVTTAPQRRIYDRAPLLETIIEVRVSGAGPSDLATLRRVRAGDETRYPEEAALMHGSVSVEMTGVVPSVAAAAASQLVGYQWRNPTGAELFRVLRDRFSYHKLRPYTRWELCRDEAQRLWIKYREAAMPQQVVGIGLRYINRLDIPVSSELSEYLLTGPEIAPGIQPEMSAYMMALTVPQVDIPNTRLVLRQGTVAPPAPAVASVMLDIDVIRDLNGSPDSTELWQAFEQLHQRQNETFEFSITDRTRGLIS